jgi:hypothetical protein
MSQRDRHKYKPQKQFKLCKICGREETNYKYHFTKAELAQQKK